MLHGIDFLHQMTFSINTIDSMMDSDTKFIIQECTSILHRFHARYNVSKISTIELVVPSMNSSLRFPPSTRCIERAHEWYFAPLSFGDTLTNEGPSLGWTKKILDSSSLRIYSWLRREAMKCRNDALSDWEAHDTILRRRKLHESSMDEAWKWKKKKEEVIMYWIT